MAQKRVLRSASRLGAFSAPRAAAEADVTPSGAHEFSSVSDDAGGDGRPSIEGSKLESPTVSPSKKRKLANARNLASETIPIHRPAGTHSSNTPLKTPSGSHVVACTQGGLDESPSEANIPRLTTSTNRLLEQACAHLIQADPRLQPLIEKHHCHLFSPEGLAEVIDPFQSLCSSIMAQQVSGAAASSIKSKFIDLFCDTGEGRAHYEKGFPSPAQIAPCDVAFLRTAGLSARKAEYIKGLAQKFVDGELNTAMLLRAGDEEIIEKLTAVRGLGLWSVQMFACFALRRTDIFSTGTKPR
ncbi:MAG: hypothetical protein LQ346_000103 [Caloplaca aetnensis]|nr:MAG: hypothetical protein LQ346_000103 [Caloplaca aetnensis]